jgi:hypothetical protein
MHIRPVRDRAHMLTFGPGHAVRKIEFRDRGAGIGHQTRFKIRVDPGAGDQARAILVSKNSRTLSTVWLVITPFSMSSASSAFTRAALRASRSSGYSNLCGMANVLFSCPG